MKISTSLILAAGLLAFSVSGASAFMHAPGPGGDGMIFVQSFKLLFDETQNKALDSLLAAQKKEMKPLFEQMKSEHEAMQSLVKAAPIKDAEIKAEVEKMSETMYQLTLKRAAFIQAVRKLATAEQLAKIDAQESRMKQRKDRFDAAMHKVMEEMPE